MALINETVETSLIEIAQMPHNREGAFVVIDLMDASLAEIDLADRKIPRSSHIGNSYPSNEAIVNSVRGAHLSLYDRTTGVDRNYQPWTIKKGGKVIIIGASAENLLTPFMKPTTEFYTQLGYLPSDLHGAKTPAHLHYLSAKLLHPDSQTYSEWILENRDYVKALADVVGKHHPLFHRRLDDQGRVIKEVVIPVTNPGEKIIETAEVLAEAVITGNPQCRDGLLLHDNEFNIYLDAVISSLDSQVDFDGEKWGYALHGAGPDMIKYATAHWRTLGGLHQAVTSKLPEMSIPRKILFGLVPTAELKLALPQQNQPELDSLATLLVEKEDLRRIKKDKSAGLDSKQAAQERELEIREAIRNITIGTRISEIVFDQSFSTHCSQYDALDQGPIYFPKALGYISFRQLREINNGLGQIIRKGQKNGG